MVTRFPVWLLDRIQNLSSPLEKARCCAVSCLWRLRYAIEEDWIRMLWCDFRYEYAPNSEKRSALCVYGERRRYQKGLLEGRLQARYFPLDSGTRLLPCQRFWSTERCDIVIVQPRIRTHDVPLLRLMRSEVQPDNVAEETTLLQYPATRRQDVDAMDVVFYHSFAYIVVLDGVLVYDLSKRDPDLLCHMYFPDDVIAALRRSLRPDLFTLNSYGYVVVVSQGWLICWHATSFQLQHATHIQGLDLSYPGGGGAFGGYVFSRCRPLPAGLIGDEMLLVEAHRPAPIIRIALPFRVREVAIDAVIHDSETLVFVAIDTADRIHALQCQLSHPPCSCVAVVTSSWTSTFEAFLSPKLDVFNGRMAALAGCSNGGEALYFWDRIDDLKSCKTKEMDVAVADVVISGDVLFISTGLSGENTLLIVDSKSLDTRQVIHSSGQLGVEDWGCLTLASSLDCFVRWQPVEASDADDL